MAMYITLPCLYVARTVSAKELWPSPFRWRSPWRPGGTPQSTARRGCIRWKWYGPGCRKPEWTSPGSSGYTCSSFCSWIFSAWGRWSYTSLLMGAVPPHSFARICSAKNSSAVSGETEYTTSSTVTQTPCWQLSIQNVPACSIRFSSPCSRISSWSRLTTWREPLMWQEDPIQIVSFICLSPLIQIGSFSYSIRYYTTGPEYLQAYVKTSQNHQPFWQKKTIRQKRQFVPCLRKKSLLFDEIFIDFFVDFSFELWYDILVMTPWRVRKGAVIFPS